MNLPRFKKERLCLANISGSPKSPVHTRPFKPGQHGRDPRKRRVSDHGLQRREARILSGLYGSDYGHKLEFGKILRYATKALNSKKNTIQSFMEQLETRLVMAIYRLKWAPSVRSAQQMLSHGNAILLDGKKVTRGTIKPGQTIRLTESGMKLQPVTQAQAMAHIQVPPYYECNGPEATLLRMPLYTEIPLACELDHAKAIKLYMQHI